MPPGGVTARETAVLDLLGEHLTHVEIGARLFISVRTVESHVGSLRRKLGLDHRSLVKYAVEQRQRQPRGATPSPTIAPLTTFVGRAQELNVVAAALGESRLVSAVGPGGVGKTRLALAAATAAAGRYADGVRLVDLVPVVDRTGVEDAVAQAVGAEPNSRQGPGEALVGALRDRQVLLVLDNCEHVVDAVAVLVEALVASCPALTVLTTSRVRLSLPFERVFRVEGLSMEDGGDAAALFIERAAAAGCPPPSEADLQRIDRICRALDGMALAVELAAVRAPSLGYDGVERGLVDQSKLLVGGARLVPRQQSMHATLDWSTAMLSGSARLVLVRMAVVVSAFDAEVAAAIAGFAPLTDDDVRSALAELVDHSLLTTAVVADGRLQHRYLEPVRQYALQHIGPEDVDAYARHRSWCRSLLDRLMAHLSADGDDTAARSSLSDVGDDVRAALAWAGAQRPVPPDAHGLAGALAAVLFDTGSIREAQGRFESAAALAPDDLSAAADLSRAAAVAKCRVRGEDALRLELAAAERAAAGGDATAAALAYARAAEMVRRFPGMFAAQPDEAVAEDAVRRAAELAPMHPVVTAARALADFVVPKPGAAPADLGLTAVLVEAADDPLVTSEYLDLASNERLQNDDPAGAARLATDRVHRLEPLTLDPAVGLELKDALHVAVYCCLGAGRLTDAASFAAQQGSLPFLHEQRDVADEELLAPAALAGHWATVLRISAAFYDDWTAAGRPSGPGRGLAPAAVALAHGLRGDESRQQEWMQILATIRRDRVEIAGHGSGYGELFTAMVLLHRASPGKALSLLRARPGPDAGLFFLVFQQWFAALTAEAAVLARDPARDDLIKVATAAVQDNRVAAVIVRRARVLDEGDRAALEEIAGSFDDIEVPYQAWRTRVLAGLVDAETAARELRELDLLEIPGAVGRNG